jgi:hypothetical protein
MVRPDYHRLARSSVNQLHRVSAERFDGPVVIALVAAISLGRRLQPHDLSMQVLELGLVHPFSLREAISAAGW